MRRMNDQTDIDPYLVEMLDRFLDNPMPINKFLEEQRVPESDRDELRGILEVAQLRREAGNNLLYAALTDPRIILNHN